MAETPGVTLKQGTEELGVSPCGLARWRKQMREDVESKAFRGQGNARDEEMAALKRELARIKKEYDLLREAAVFFVKGSK